MKLFETAFTESLQKEELKGNQKKLDKAPPYGKLTSADFVALRSSKKSGKKLDKEGNEFSGKLAAAKASGEKSFEIGGKTVQVKEKKKLGKEGNEFSGKLAAAKAAGKKSFNIGGKTVNVKEEIKQPKSKGNEKPSSKVYKENIGLGMEAPRPVPAPAPEPSDEEMWKKSLDKDTNPADFDAATNPALKLDTEGVQKAREWIKKLEDMATFINGMDENSLNSQINALEMRNSIPFKGIVRRKEKQITDIAEKLRALAELFKTVVTGSQKKIQDATAR